MRGTWLMVVSMAAAVAACEGAPTADQWRSECAESGYESGSREMEACVAELEAEYQAECLSAVAYCE